MNAMPQPCNPDNPLLDTIMRNYGDQVWTEALEVAAKLVLAAASTGAKPADVAKAIRALKQRTS